MNTGQGMRTESRRRMWPVLAGRLLMGCIALIGSGAAQPALAQTVEYIHTDALGSPMAVTDTSGKVIERTVYEPYGMQVNRAVADGPGYTGHVSDAATGLSYMQQRYYDPHIGRFLSVDPVTADTVTGWNFNRYNYAANNPYKFKDPDGRIIDTVVDVGFMIYDVYKIATEGATATNMTALGADAAATLIPFATGAGTVVRGGVHAVDAAKAADKVGDAAKGSRRPTQAQREGALERAKGADGKERCTYCGTELDRKAGKPNSAEIDHKLSYSRGGKTEDGNLDAACRSCNRGKGAKELGAEWIPPKDREQKP